MTRLRRQPHRRPVTTETVATGHEGPPVPWEEPELGPYRRCIVTRERRPKERMIRFVVGPDRTLVPDLAAKLPGRGLWLSAQSDMLESARLRGAFARATKGFAASGLVAPGPVIVPADLTDLVRAGLARRVAELLGLARRAGQAVAGYEKAREWLRTGRAALILQASDGSEAERRRFLAGGSVPAMAPMPAAALGAVFGRDHTVHVAVAAGKLAESLAVECGRLAGFAEPGSQPAERIERPGHARSHTEQAGR